MSAALLQRLLDGTLTDPDTGERVSVPTRLVAIEPTSRGQESSFVSRLDLGRRIAVIADPMTWQALGARISGALGADFAVAPVILPEHPHADLDTVQLVRARSTVADELVAVGSGTISDLAKYAAHLDRKPYACFATAPSMNGYVSVNAAIMAHGVKKSLAATAPRGVFVDLDVLCRAPRRMIVAGFGDSICRPTAQADWLLAHLLLDQPYRSLPFQLLAEDETALIDHAEDLLTGDIAAMMRLARTLVLSGFGMTICGGSYPASQGEHLIAHFLEMRVPEAAATLHGEQIAVSTLTMARIQSAVLDREKLRLSPSTATEAAFKTFYGPEAGVECWEAFSRKAIDADRAVELNARLNSHWPEMRRAIRAVHRSPAELESALRRVQGPVRSTELGVSDNDYLAAVLHAREIRDRFTFLDLAAETGGIAAAGLC